MPVVLDHNNGHSWEIALLGEAVVYPGHPIVNATAIMDRYPSFIAASQPPVSSQYPAALADGFIHGAGCAVHAALDVLKLAREQGLEAAYREAARYWDGWLDQSPAHNRPGYERGLLQMQRLKGRFEAQLQIWETRSDPGTKHRLAA